MFESFRTVVHSRFSLDVPADGLPSEFKSSIVHATPSPSDSICARSWFFPAWIAWIAGFVCLATLDPAGDRPGLPEGPGLTTDEVLNIEPGIVLFRQLTAYGWGLLDPNSWYEVYSDPQYQHDYPPLGRLILAASHDLMQAVWPVDTDPRLPARAYFTVQARAASALALAVTIFFVGWFVSRWEGQLAGAVAALALALMPRVLAHGRIANIETLVGMYFAITVLATADRWSNSFREWSAAARTRWSIPWKPAVLTGVLLGLTLLTKIQGVLIPVPFSIWAVWRWGRQGITGVAAVGVISALVLFLGWPWLWINPLANFLEYLGQGSRDHLYCWYLGHRYLDHDVPWHFPFVVFTTTIPAGILALGGMGILARGRDGLPGWADSRLQLVLAVIVFSLLLFAIPGVTVYDSERLFLVAYPLWAALVGRGAASLLRSIRSPAIARSLLAILLLAESYTLVTLNPCQLSYYNWLVGGLRGAEKLGLEPTYWADSVTRDFQSEIVRQLPDGADLHVAPVLHPLQLPGMQLQSPQLQRHRIVLKSWDDQIRSEVRYVLVYRRHADPWDTLQEVNGQPPPGMKRLAELRREGVQLAVLYAVDY